MAYEIHSVDVEPPSGTGSDDAAVQDALEELYRLTAEVISTDPAVVRSGWTDMGGCLRFAPGRYRLTEPLRVRAHGIRLVGCRTTLEFDFAEGAEGPAVAFLPVYGQTVEVTVDGLATPVEVNVGYLGGNLYSGISGIEIVRKDTVWPTNPIVRTDDLDASVDNEYDPAAADTRSVGLLVLNCRYFRARDLSVRGFGVGILVEALSYKVEETWYQHVWACSFRLGRLVDNQLGVVERAGDPVGYLVVNDQGDVEFKKTTPTIVCPLFVGGHFEYSEEVVAELDQAPTIVGYLEGGRHVHLAGRSIGKTAFHGTSFGAGPTVGVELKQQQYVKTTLLSGCRFAVGPGREGSEPDEWLRSHGGWTTIEGGHMAGGVDTGVRIQSGAGPTLLLNTELDGVQDDNSPRMSYGLTTTRSIMAFRFPDTDIESA